MAYSQRDSALAPSIFDTSSNTLTIPAVPFGGVVYTLSFQLNANGFSFRLTAAESVADLKPVNPAFFDGTSSVLHIPELAVSDGTALDDARYAVSLIPTVGEGINYRVLDVSEQIGIQSSANSYQGLVGSELAMAMIADLQPQLQLQGDYTEVGIFDERGRLIALHGREANLFVTDFYHYNAEDRLLSITETFGENFDVTSCESFFYFDNGRRLYSSKDFPGSSRVRLTRYEWEGEQLFKTRTQIEGDSSSIDLVVAEAYDPNGLLLASVTEGGASSQYFYENGVLQDELRTTSTGTSQYRYIYNAEGILMQSLILPTRIRW